MVETVGVSKSSVSRETIEASEAALQEVLERRLEDKDILVVYLDGLHLRGTMRDRGGGGGHLRAQVGFGHPRRGHRERGRLQRSAGKPGGARLGSATPTAVCDRWVEGFTQRHQRGVRTTCCRAALPRAQAAERGGAVAARTATASALADPSGVETGRER